MSRIATLAEFLEFLAALREEGPSRHFHADHDGRNQLNPDLEG